MKKIFLLLFLFLFSWNNAFVTVLANPLSDAQSEAEPSTREELSLGAASAILMDATTGKVLYEKNSREKQFPASITKLMTVLLALENTQLTDTITFSHDAVYGIERDSNHIAIVPGEVLTMEQALYAIMLQSANEVSLGVAELIDGSCAAFAKHMTERGKELGATDTLFQNPHGLHDENHYTTAYDMALIAKALLQYPKFEELMKTTTFIIPPTNMQPETRYLHTQHSMIKPTSRNYYESVLGGKTGFTDQAGNTLVSYARRGNTTLIAVVLKDTNPAHYQDTAKLFDYGFANYQTVCLANAGSISQPTAVTEKYRKEEKELGSTNLTLEKDVMQTLPIGLDLSSITRKIDAMQSYSAPVNKGDALGSVSFYEGDELLATADLTAASSIAATPTEALQAAEKAVWMVRAKIIGVVLIGLFLLGSAVVFFCRRHAKKRRRAYPYRYSGTQYRRPRSPRKIS